MLFDSGLKDERVGVKRKLDDPEAASKFIRDLVGRLLKLISYYEYLVLFVSNMPDLNPFFINKNIKPIQSIQIPHQTFIPSLQIFYFCTLLTFHFIEIDYEYNQMIVRGVRSPKGQTHKQLQSSMQALSQENKQLRMDLLRTEQRLLESQQSKRKYKTKYRQAKQKIEILGLVGGFNHKSSEQHEGCLSPRTKTTRIKTASEEDFHSLKFGLAQSEFDQNISTKPYLPENQDYPGLIPKRNHTPTTTHRQDTTRDDSRMLQSLMKLHEQLEKLSLQIENKTNVSSNIVNLEGELYRKMELVVEKVSQLEVRDLERDKKRMSREREKSTRRYNSSMKAIQKIGHELLDFKVDS